MSTNQQRLSADALTVLRGGLQCVGSFSGRSKIRKLNQLPEGVAGAVADVLHGGYIDHIDVFKFDGTGHVGIEFKAGEAHVPVYGHERLGSMTQAGFKLAPWVLDRAESERIVMRRWGISVSLFIASVVLIASGAGIERFLDSEQFVLRGITTLGWFCLFSAFIAAFLEEDSMNRRRMKIVATVLRLRGSEKQTSELTAEPAQA